MFLRFIEETKAYRMYDPDSKRIIISRNVIFEEEEKWEWGKSSEEAPINNLKWEEEGKQDEEKQEGDKNVSYNLDNSDPPTPTNLTSPDQGRKRNEPTRIKDYVSGEGLSDEEDEIQQLAMEMQQLAMFASTDPTTFEEAAKCPT